LVLHALLAAFFAIATFLQLRPQQPPLQPAKTGIMHDTANKAQANFANFMKIPPPLMSA
jgi:hypothetical protein